MIPPGQPYNPFPYRRAKEAGAAVAVLTRPEEQLKKDLRAFEKVQASRPMKPPTVKR